MQLLIVTHFSDEFMEDTVKFYEYFWKVLKLPEIHFYTIETYLKGKRVEGVLKELVGKNSPLIIYYGGHGLEDGWQLSNKYQIKYNDIFTILKDQREPVIFVNDCCFGMAPQDYLPQLQCPYLLLGLAPKTKEGFGSMVPGIIKCWKNHQPADPKHWVENKKKLSQFVLEKCAARLRFGDNLDPLCYPSLKSR